MNHRTYLGPIVGLALALAPLSAAASEGDAPPAGKAAAPAPAAAASGRPLTGKADDDCARARRAGRACVLEFRDDEVYGYIFRPDGDDLAGRTLAVFSSLLHLRADFRGEIIESAEALP